MGLSVQTAGTENGKQEHWKTLEQSRIKKSRTGKKRQNYSKIKKKKKKKKKTGANESKEKSLLIKK